MLFKLLHHSNSCQQHQCRWGMAALFNEARNVGPTRQRPCCDWPAGGARWVSFHNMIMHLHHIIVFVLSTFSHSISAHRILLSRVGEHVRATAAYASSAAAPVHEDEKLVVLAHAGNLCRPPVERQREFLAARQPFTFTCTLRLGWFFSAWKIFGDELSTRPRSSSALCLVNVGIVGDTQY